MAVAQMVNYINCKILCMILTSPKAPLPMMVKSSKSSTHILCLLSRINSVSFRSKSLIRLICSSSGTSEVANFLSNTHRLQWKQKQIRVITYKTETLFPNFYSFYFARLSPTNFSWDQFLWMHNFNHKPHTLQQSRELNLSCLVFIYLFIYF